ncbi:MAG: sulfotransferase [Gammaproteobacteria bacterium]|nr:sulfotransferase [Gammaproteobacteria bacterium]
MSQYNITPNFFIVGAPRCGTTAMGNYLSDHRDICFSLPKEPHYFSTDMPAMQFAETESDYLKCYGHCSNNEYLAIGEGSVWYLLFGSSE